MRYLLFLLICLCSYSYAQNKDCPYVILISFDGFRYDYVSKFDLPNFKKFINQGAAADALIPSFPSKTFPNHYTIVTGLYPGNHGLVDNSFYDKQLDVVYKTEKRELVENPVFYGGTPLWQLTQQQGVPSASCFWVGSEAPVHGAHPTYYSIYDHNFPNAKRIDRTIGWLELPAKERPHFISLYFSFMDSEGHTYGPNSAELKTAAHTADSLLGYLMTRLKKIKLPVNVVIVSDHGMLEVKQSEEPWISLSNLFDLSDSTFRIVNNGTHVHVYTSNSDSLFKVLKKQEENFIAFKKSELPVAWHYNHERVGDLLLVANSGFQFRIKNRKQDDGDDTKDVFGAHGFDPYTVKDMHGIFYASGPNIKPGKRLPPFENVHIFPLLVKILQLQSPHVDGNSKVLESIYRK